MKNICILGANFETGNMGVSALLMGAIKCINTAYPDAQVFVLDYSSKPSVYQCNVNNKTIIVPLINIRFSKKIFLANNISNLILFSLLAKGFPGLIKHNKWLEKIAKADMVVSIAGGDSFSDIYGMARLIYVSLPQILVSLMNKRLILMPQTLGPFKTVFAKMIARFIMHRSHDIIGRDEWSVSETKLLLKNHESARNVRFCYDTGFVLDPVKPKQSDLTVIEKHKEAGNRIYGINISGLLWMGGYNRNNMFALKTDYKKLTHEIIMKLLSIKNAFVVFIPHVLGEGEECDTVAILKAVAELPEGYTDRIKVITGNYNQSEIKYLIGLCDFFVGARMHACIAAMSQCIPTVAIAYSKKFKGVMESIGMEEFCVDPRVQETGEIMKGVDNAISRAVETRALLQGVMPKVTLEVLNIFN